MLQCCSNSNHYKHLMAVAQYYQIDGSIACGTTTSHSYIVSVVTASS
jgi:hypothetical protein